MEKKRLKFQWDRHRKLAAAIAVMALLPCGCAMPEVLDQVPGEISLQEESQSKEIYLDELEGVEKPKRDSGRIRKVIMEDLEDSALESFLYDGGSRYAYESLSDSEKLWYADMEQAVGSMAEKVRLSEEGIKAGLDEDNVDKIFQSVLCDHPELFYVEGYSYTLYTRAEKTVAIEFSGTYSLDRETAEARKKEIDSAVTSLLRDAPKEGGDYEKVRYVYETLIQNTDYDIEAKDNQNIYSVFVNRESVCQGYAKAVQYLLNRMGIFCTLVQGRVLDTNEGHAWNLVKLDGDYYYLDATWGDISYQGEESDFGGNLPQVSYDYFCITTEQLERTHRIEGMIGMPPCVAQKDNYYVRENALFSEYDRAQMTDLVSAAAQQGRSDITLRCDSEACYGQMCDILLEQQEIFHYLPGTGSFAYTKNDTQWTLTFFMMTSE